MLDVALAGDSPVGVSSFGSSSAVVHSVRTVPTVRWWLESVLVTLKVECELIGVGETAVVPSLLSVSAAVASGLTSVGTVMFIEVVVAGVAGVMSPVVVCG